MSKWVLVIGSVAVMAAASGCGSSSNSGKTRASKGGYESRAPAYAAAQTAMAAPRGYAHAAQPATSYRTRATTTTRATREAVQLHPAPTGPANQPAMRPIPVEVRERAADGTMQAAAVSTHVEYDAYGRPVIVQTLPAVVCPGPATATGRPGEAVWIGCGVPPAGAALPPVMSAEVRNSLGIRAKS